MVSLRGRASLVAPFQSVDFQENCDASYIVDHSVVFFPFLGAGPDDSVASLLRAVLNVVRPDYPGDLLVGEELPDTVTRDHNKFI